MGAEAKRPNRPSEQYRLMCHFAVATLHFYRDSITTKSGETCGEFAERNAAVLRQVGVEAGKYFDYELSHEQIGLAIKAYLAPSVARPNPPQVNWDYRAFVRTFPCIVCHKHRWVEFAHFGPRGLGQKADDMDGLPVCAFDHRISAKSYHALGPRRFAEVHLLDIQNLQEQHRALWFEKLKGGTE